MIAIAANSPMLAGEFAGWRRPAAGVGPAGFRALRPGPGRQRRRSDQRLGALRAEGAGHARASHQTPNRASARLGAVRRLGRRSGAARRPPADRGRPGLPPDHAVSAGAAPPAGWRSVTWTAFPTRSGLLSCSRSSRCSTTRRPPTSPPRPPNRSRPHGTAPRRSDWVTAAQDAAIRCVRAAAERAPAELVRRARRQRPHRAARRPPLRTGGPVSGPRPPPLRARGRVLRAHRARRALRPRGPAQPRAAGAGAADRAAGRRGGADRAAARPRRLDAP